jgi:hypothetical protein
MSCHLPFESHSLSKCYFTTYSWSLSPKTPTCDMIIIKIFTWFTNLFQSYGITMFDRYYKFHKDEKTFNIFLKIFAFRRMLWHIYFWHKNILTSHHIRLKHVVFVEFDLFGFWPTIICKNIVKILHNNEMVEVQIWDP